METVHNLIIIGGGPAGLTAALYAGRANLRPRLLLGAHPGGQLTTTTLVENYPGFPEGIQGPELMERMQAQAANFGAELLYESCTALDVSSRPLKVSSDSGETYLAKAVIIATGANPRLLGIEGEQTWYNLGVHTCAVCDGAFYKGKEVAVVGGGDSALTDALYLKTVCGKVHLLVRRDELRASQIMRDRVLNDPQIQVHWNTLVDSIEGEQGKGTTGATLRDRLTGQTRNLPLDAVFIAIGHVPATQVFGESLDKDNEGYLKVHDHIRTRIEGVFAAGDVHDHHFRQAITAAGFGCMAAIEAERWLSLHGG